MFSRNISKRYAENQKYLAIENKVRHFFGQKKYIQQQRKEFHIYSCPQCKQKIRIPRGKGKVSIRCPKCGNEFIKKSWCSSIVEKLLWKGRLQTNIWKSQMIHKEQQSRLIQQIRAIRRTPENCRIGRLFMLWGKRAHSHAPTVRKWIEKTEKVQKSLDWKRKIG